MAILFGALVASTQNEVSASTIVLTCVAAAPVGAEVIVRVAADDPANLLNNAESYISFIKKVVDSRLNPYLPIFGAMGVGGTFSTAADDAIAAIFKGKLRTALEIGDTITIHLRAALTAKAAVAEYFTVTAGNTLMVYGIDFVGGSGGDASVGRLANSGDPERLLFGMMGFEGPQADTVPVPTNFTALTKIGTSNVTAASNATVAGSYRILAGGTAPSGYTWNPGGPARDMARIFVVFEEDTDDLAPVVEEGFEGTLVSNLLANAFAKSSKNEVRDLEVERTALIEIVNRAVQSMFAVAARVNPTFYAKVGAVVGVASRWQRPTDVNLLFRIETAAFAEVALVPYDDRTAEAGFRAAVYAFAKEYVSAGNVGDPGATDSLNFWYSRTPELVTEYADFIDEDFPTDFLELLHYEIAIHLALRDRRYDEVEQLKSERNKWLSLYVEHVEHVNAAEVRRFDQMRRFNSPTTGPLTALVAG